MVLRLTSKILLGFSGFSHYAGGFFVFACNLSEANIAVFSMHICIPPLVRLEPSGHFQIHLTKKFL